MHKKSTKDCYLRFTQGVCEEKSGGMSELSTSLCLYLGRYEPISSKYPSYRLLVEFLSELSFCYLLLVGSSSVLVTVALV